MSKILWVAVLALLSGCQSSGPEETTTSIPSGITSSATKEQSGANNKEPIQHIVQRTHPFSSDQKPDYFRLALHGKSISKGEVEFTITTQDGTKIFEENFPAADLEASMVYEIKTPSSTESERESYILKRMDDFVQPADFISPAIAPNAPVQADPKAIGFKYLLGKEDGRLLVYDPEQKKAVRYGSFGG